MISQLSRNIQCQYSQVTALTVEDAQERLPELSEPVRGDGGGRGGRHQQPPADFPGRGRAAEEEHRAAGRSEGAVVQQGGRRGPAGAGEDVGAQAGAGDGDAAGGGAQGRGIQRRFLPFV